MNPPQMFRKINRSLIPNDSTRRARLRGRNNSETPPRSQRKNHLPQVKHAIISSQFRPQIICEDLYVHVITKYPLEGLILRKLIEDGEYQISSS